MKKNPENLRLSAYQKGFTLLEVLVAMVILSVGLLGMASLTASIIRNNSFSDDFTTATALAQDKLESIANAAWNSATVIAAGHILLYDDPAVANNTIGTYTLDSATDYQDVNINQCGTANCSGTCTTVPGHCKFTRTWNIWDRTDIVNPATRKDIAVIVSWTSDSGLTRRITMATIKTQT